MIKSNERKKSVLMLLENCGMPDDSRVRNEAIGLVENGFDVIVICPREPGEKWFEKYQGMYLYRYPAPVEFGGLVGYLWEFGYSLVVAWIYAVYILFRRGFAVIHVHCPPDMNCLVAIFFKIFLRKQYVLDTHDLSPELYEAQKDGKPNKLVLGGLRRFERLAIKWADRCIATNETQRAVHIARGGADPDACYVVRNGPAKSFLDIAEPTTKISSDGRLVIGYVGMIGFQDGVDAMIEALKDLRDRLERTDFVGVIVGDGPALPDLKDLVAQTGMQNQVIFTGLIPYEEVPAYIAAFDICVTPDPSNPYNDSCTTIKTIEYMAQAKPTVAFETPENKVTAQDAAIYAPNNDPHEMALRFAQLMDDPQRRAEMGRWGRQRMESKLAWKHQEAELLRLYRGLMAGDDWEANADAIPERIAGR